MADYPKQLIKAHGKWQRTTDLPKVPKCECRQPTPHKRTHAEEMMTHRDNCPKLFAIAEAMANGKLFPPIVAWVNAEGHQAIIAGVLENGQGYLTLIHENTTRATATIIDGEPQIVTYDENENPIGVIDAQQFTP